MLGGSTCTGLQIAESWQIGRHSGSSCQHQAEALAFLLPLKTGQLVALIYILTALKTSSTSLVISECTFNDEVSHFKASGTAAWRSPDTAVACRNQLPTSQLIRSERNLKQTAWRHLIHIRLKTSPESCETRRRKARLPCLQFLTDLLQEVKELVWQI